MTERERWVIYPLLFFLFLLVTRDRLMTPIRAEFDTVVCRRIVVESLSGRKVIEASSLLDSGFVSIYGVDEPGELKSVGAGSPDENPVLQLGSDEGSGFVALYGPAAAPTLRLGHHQSNELSGLMAVEPMGDPLSANSDSDDQFWGLNLPWKSYESKSSETDPQSEQSAGETTDVIPAPSSTK